MPDKKCWFYTIGSRKEGPVTHQELREMYQKGIIDDNTYVWNEGLRDWERISEVASFNLTNVDEPAPVPRETMAAKEKFTEQHPKPRIWVRFWARIFDYLLFAFVIGVITALMRIPVYNLAYLYLPVIFIWAIIESILLSTWGTTPGKWLLKVHVRSQDGHKLTFRDSLSRAFSVWFIGVGAGLPIVFLITMIVASVKLSNTGHTTWDRQQSLSVSHGHIGVIRSLIAIVIIAFFILLPMYGQYQNP